MSYCHFTCHSSIFAEPRRFLFWIEASKESGAWFRDLRFLKTCPLLLEPLPDLHLRCVESYQVESFWVYFASSALFVRRRMIVTAASAVPLIFECSDLDACII